MTNKIITYINDEKVDLYYGAKLKHALLKLDEDYYKMVLANKAEIRDQDGNHVGVTGSIDRGFKYYIVEK